MDETPQIDKFKHLAQELECDEDEGAFDERLRKLAAAPKSPPAKQSAKPE